MLLELERSLLLPLAGLELGLFFLVFSRLLSKSVLECLLLVVEGVVLVLEVLYADTVIQSNNMVSMQVMLMFTVLCYVAGAVLTIFLPRVCAGQTSSRIMQQL